LNWSYNCRIFDVNIYDPFIVEKDYIGYGNAFTNYAFVHGSIFAEIEILEMDESHPVWIGLYCVNDKAGDVNMHEGYYSISIGSNGQVMKHRSTFDYEPFKKGDRISIAFNKLQVAIKRIGSNNRYITAPRLGTSGFYIGVSTLQKKCTFRLRYLTEKDIIDNGTLKPDDANYVEIMNGYATFKSHLSKIEQLCSKEFIDKLIEYNLKNDHHVWDPRPIVDPLMINYIEYPDFHTIKLVAQIGNTHYFRTLAIFDSGIHFFEVEMTNVPIDTSSFVGVIEKNYDYVRRQGKYIAYNNTGTLHTHNKPYQQHGKRVSANGTKIGVYLDLENGTVEFFVNGESQGHPVRIDFSPVQFFVTVSRENSQYRILPSNLETYFAYMEYNSNFKGQLTISDESIGIALINRSICKVSDEFTIKCDKSYDYGRQYFEATLRNINGVVQFGLTGYTHQFRVGVQEMDVEQIDLFDDNKFEDPIVENEVVLGVLVDFDERMIEFYKNRVKVHERPNDHDIYRSINGYINGMNVNKLNAGDMIIELNNNAYDEMKDTLILFG